MSPEALVAVLRAVNMRIDSIRGHLASPGTRTDAVLSALREELELLLAGRDHLERDGKAA
jgi:hypothetical protein